MSDIAVTYDTNDAKNGKYYNTDRTATIAISERYFSNDDVQLMVSRSNGDNYAVTPNFILSENEYSVNGKYTWIMDYTFSDDGDDYTLGITCTNRAKHTVVYEPNDNDIFTIDQTLPTISMDISGTSTDSNGYYSEARTATITVNEHNFNEADFQLHIAASDNGEGIAAPALSGFSNDGDIHTATMVFDRDEEIVISADYTDMAGNAAETLAEQKFVVDLTDPSIDIDTSSLVENKTYGKAETVTPKILITDTNFTQGGVNIKVEGRKNGVIQAGISTDIVANGLLYTVSGIDADDVYTLTATVMDMSGRTKEYTTTFHVNKTGSSYAFGNALQTVMDKLYVKAVGEDLYIVETNVDPLTISSITYSRGGMIAELNKDTDYSVSVATNSYGWQEYTYRINQSVFKEEGEYKITISSTDAAGNNSDNSSKGQAISFVVDETKPTQVVTGVTNGGVYTQDELSVTIEVYDNIAVNTLDVALNGETTSYAEDEIAAGNGKIFIKIPSSSKVQTMEVSCMDYAGNVTDKERYSFTVSTNAFITFKARYLSKPLFWIILGCLVVTAGGGIGFAIVFKRRKKEVKND